MALNDDAYINELDQQEFDALDMLLQRQEKQQLESLLAGQAERGFLSSGETLKNVSEQILGPGQERRGQALVGLKRESALRKQDERLGEQNFQRQRQLAQEDFDRQLQGMERQAAYAQELARLQDLLEGNPNSFSNLFRMGLASGAAQSVIGGAKGLAGGVAGLLGGGAGTAGTATAGIGGVTSASGAAGTAGAGGAAAGGTGALAWLLGPLAIGGAGALAYNNLGDDTKDKIAALFPGFNTGRGLKGIKKGAKKIKKKLRL